MTVSPSDMGSHEPLHDPARIAAVVESGLLDAHDDSDLDQLTELAARVLDVPQCMICLVLPDRQVFASRYDAGEPGLRETPIEYSYCQYVVDQNAPLVVPDARLEPLLASNPAIAEYGAIAYLGWPLVDPDGHLMGTLCAIDTEPREWGEEDLRMLRSFTGIVRTELQLRAARATSGEEAAASYFAAAVHELRTPLGSISGFASTLASRWHDIDEDQRLKFISIIDEQSQRLARLVDGLLLQSQVDSGHLVAVREPVPIVPVLEEAARQFPSADIRVVAQQDVAALVDASQLEQVLVNLVSNAIKYGEPPIELSLRPGGSRVEVTVRDHGDGIPEGTEGELFERYSRIPGRRRAKGSGLGLWIVRELATANGGRCRYEQAPDGGACFVVELEPAPPG